MTWLFGIVWWGIVLFACWKASRAWGALLGGGALVALLLTWWVVPLLGGALSLLGAFYVGYQAENALDARQLEDRSVHDG